MLNKSDILIIIILGDIADKRFRRPIATASRSSVRLSVRYVEVGNLQKIISRLVSLGVFAVCRAPDYHRGHGIIGRNIPKVAAIDSFGILRNLTSDKTKQ